MTDTTPGVPFARLIGLRFVHASATEVVGRIDCTSEHCQSSGFVHGGVYTAMVETLASIGARLRAAELGLSVLGVHNSTDFLRPHRGGPIEGVARSLHDGRRQQLWRVSISRAADRKVLAVGQLRLLHVEPAAEGA